MMKSKLAIRVSVLFLIGYGIASTFGSIFLVTWGSTSLFKTIMLFFLKFPIDWAYLIVERSVLYLLVHIMFWTLTVYFVVFIVEKLIIQFKMNK